MNKNLLLLFATIGGVIGAYVPVILFGVDGLSAWSILGSTIGGLVGIWIGVKLSNRFG